MASSPSPKASGDDDDDSDSDANDANKDDGASSPNDDEMST